MAIIGASAKNDISNNLPRIVPRFLKLLASLIFVLIASLQYYRSFTTTTTANQHSYQDDTSLFLEGRGLAAERRDQHVVACSEITNATLLSSSTTTGVGALTQASLNNNNNEIPALKVDEKDRSLVLIHVGKAGGMTIRRNLAMQCRWKSLVNTPETNSQWIADKCKQHLERGDKLALQTRSVFHLWDKNDSDIELATSFVVTLRNPVDRIISAFRYSHPANCRTLSNDNDHDDTNVKIPTTWGCTAKNYGFLDKPEKIAYKVFVFCFPSPAMEDFAQSVTEPWRPNLHFDQQNFTKQQRSECRELAKHLVQGRRYGKNVPHMQCNYEHYAVKAIYKYPEKELFGIRTEHEWDDLVKLEQLIGGSGTFQRDHGKSESHGSEFYYPSPISTEAYHKLCCALEHEIEVYLDILSKSLNFDNVTKQETENSLRQNCGVSISWPEWRLSCRRRK